jgi:hypothetical protein
MQIRIKLSWIRMLPLDHVSNVEVFLSSGQFFVGLSEFRLTFGS